MRTLSEQQARAFYDRLGKKQDTQAFYEDPAIQALLAHGDFEDACVVYEFGCGTGRLAERILRDYLPATSWYRGVDISSTMVELARQRLIPFGDRAGVQLSDGSVTIEAPDGSIDRIVSTYVLDLLPLPKIRAFLDEANRVLTWDGRLCLVGLTEGTTPVSRAVAGVWKAVHRLRPGLVGGCRPLKLIDLLPPDDWTVIHHEVVVAYGIPSEVLVAAPHRRRRGHGIKPRLVRDQT